MHTVRFYDEIQEEDLVKASNLPKNDLFNCDPVDKQKVFFSPRTLYIWFEIDLNICPQIGWEVTIPQNLVEQWDLWDDINPRVGDVKLHIDSGIVFIELKWYLTNYAEDLVDLFNKVTQIFK